ncbi:MAG: DUF6438 domain-containing protein [Pseudomonadota bacterium]|nr:DUF6438 domain-containing protein [Pseudomonadota bacterium]
MGARNSRLSRRNIVAICMLLVISLGAALWLSILGFHRPEPPSAPVIQSRKVEAIHLPDYTIRLERTPCYGPCPSYVVTVSGDGRVLFDGLDRRDRFTPHPVPRFVRERQLTQNEHVLVVQMIEQSGFWKLKPRYELEPFRDESGEMVRVDVTDIPTLTLSVTRENETKSVYQHIVPCRGARGHGYSRDVTKAIRTYVPDSFCTLVETIDAVTCSAFWGRQAIPQSPTTPDPRLLVQARCEATS